MKRAAGIIGKIIRTVISLAAVAAVILTIISVNAINKQNKSIAGYRGFIVLSDSMKATDFEAGDVVLIKETDPDTLDEGDIIAYISQNDENFGEVVTHKIRRRTTDAYGSKGFITYGTTSNTDDEAVVTYEYVVGKYVGRVPKIGKFFSFLKTTPGYICCVLVPFVFLIGMQGIDCVAAFKDYKKSQEEEIAAEKAELAKEREETQKMLEELRALKESLANQHGNGDET